MRSDLESTFRTGGTEDPVGSSVWVGDSGTRGTAAATSPVQKTEMDFLGRPRFGAGFSADYESMQRLTFNTLALQSGITIKKLPRNSSIISTPCGVLENG